MRITIDIRHLAAPHPSGVGLYTLELLRAMLALSRDHTFVLRSSGSKRARAFLPDLQDPRVELRHLGLPNRLVNLSTLMLRRPTLDGEIVFLPNINFVSIPRGTPYVLALHDLSFIHQRHLYSLKNRLWHWLVNTERLADGAAAVIVPSRSAAQDVTEHLGVAPERVHVIALAASPAFTPEPQPQDHGVRSRCHLPKRFALFVGDQHPRKNLEGIMEGMRRYREQTGDTLALVVAGKAHGSAPTTWTHSIGYVRDEDRPALYRLAEVTVFPSLYEGFGVPILESFACGTPVITSNTSAMPETGGDAALYVDPYNPQDLADALRELAQSPELRAHLTAKGLERVKEFSWTKTAEKTLHILDTVLASRSNSVALPPGEPRARTKTQV